VGSSSDSSFWATTPMIFPAAFASFIN
jgi:hypothetical protein